MHNGGGGGGLVETNFQLLMLSSNLLKSKIPMLRVGGGGGACGNQFPTFDPEFKFPKIQNSHVEGGWVGGGVMETNFQLLMLSTNLLKSKIPMLRVGGWVGEAHGNQFPTFDAEFKFAKIQNSHFGTWCCHPVCISGELADFDTKFCNTFWASASQIDSSLRKLINQYFLTTVFWVDNYDLNNRLFTVLVLVS